MPCPNVRVLGEGAHYTEQPEGVKPRKSRFALVLAQNAAARPPLRADARSRLNEIDARELTFPDLHDELLPHCERQTLVADLLAIQPHSALVDHAHRLGRAGREADTLEDLRQGQ